MVDKELTMTSDEVLDYIKNNFKEFDKVDIAYNRVSAKGDVLGVDLSDFRGKPSCRVMIALDGDCFRWWNYFWYYWSWLWRI